MTHADQIVLNAIATGRHTIEEIAASTVGKPVQLSEANVALSVVYLVENDKIFHVKSTGKWWLREKSTMIVRAA